MRGPEKRRFLGEVRHALGLIMLDPGAQPAAPHFVQKMSTIADGVIFRHRFHRNDRFHRIA